MSIDPSTKYSYQNISIYSLDTALKLWKSLTTLDKDTHTKYIKYVLLNILKVQGSFVSRLGGDRPLSFDVQSSITNISLCIVIRNGFSV